VAPGEQRRQYQLDLALPPDHQLAQAAGQGSVEERIGRRRVDRAAFGRGVTQ